jgi:predicted small metal-binding protein
MAYMAACHDLASDCDMVFHADSVEEMQIKISAHGKRMHGIDIASMPRQQSQPLLYLIKAE